MRLQSELSQISLGEGGTPLLLASFLGPDTYIKAEYLAPTGSFKDRGAAYAIARLLALGVREIADDSAANGGLSYAAYAGRAGIGCRLYAGNLIPERRIRQVEALGAQFVLVSGQRPKATAAAIADGAYFAGHAWDPYFIDGVSTIADELVDQIGAKLSRVIFPLGQGTLLLGLLRGFRELVEEGRIAESPELIGVQTDACCPVFDRLAGRSPERPNPSSQIAASGIAVPDPVRLRELLDVAQKGAARVISIPDAEVHAASLALARHGFFVEPTSAVVLPALRQLNHPNGRRGATVVILTSSGFKP